MYADDNQLFISFIISEFSAKIAHLQATVDLVSQWMSSNLLLLNQSKTEFLLIGLPVQLPKISNPSLLMPTNVKITPTSSAHNLGVIIDSTLSLSDHISSVSKSCFLSIRDLGRIRNTLDHTTAHTTATSLIHSKQRIPSITPLPTLLPHLSSTLSSITATHSFRTFPRLNLMVFSLFSTLPLEQYLKSPKFYHINPLLKSLHWLKFNSVFNMESYLSPTKLFSLVNLFISIAFSLFNPIVLLAPLTSLPCNVNQFSHVSK